MSGSILRETTPLSEKDCFMVFSREKTHFDFPLHIHAEYELNFIENAAGAQRIVGDSITEINNLEMVLIANKDLEHGWFDHVCRSKRIKEITIQFHPDLLNDQILNKHQFRSIRTMFEKATYGIAFSQKIIEGIKNKVYELAAEKEGFYSVMRLFALLNDLSEDRNMQTLSSRSFHEDILQYDSRRVEKVFQYLTAKYKERVTLGEVSDLVGMTEVSFSRFLKQRTGRTFIDTLNDIRLGHASRLLIDTTHSISEIALLCGFNNLSNFNRIFMKKKGCTPTDFQDKYRNSKFFL